MLTNDTKPLRIYYGEGEHLFGDLRIPNGDGPFPVAMLIHGGFWRSQFDLEQLNGLAARLTKEGIATWNVEYRRVGNDGGGWPGTLLDNAHALDYVSVLAKTFPLDVTRTIAIGHSAGGHLALWLAARKKLPETSPLYTSHNPHPLKGVISLAGVCDLKKMHEIHEWKEKLFGIVDNPTRDLLNGTPEEHENRYLESSPKELLPLETTVVLIHGTLDVNVPYGLSENFANEAKELGDDVILKKLTTVEHFGLIQPDSDAWPVVLHTAKQLVG